jgi:hypothetical protein
MRKNPIQKKALRKVEQRRVNVAKERREQKRRILMGLESKADKANRLASILNNISMRSAVLFFHYQIQVV